MKLDSSGRTRLAVFLLTAFAILSSGQLLYKSLRSGIPQCGTDVVSLGEQRYAHLKSSLPCSGVVGYVADGRYFAENTLGSFCLAQYALAPLVVVRSRDCEWVVGDFGADPSPTQLSADEGFVLVAEGSGGVKLFRRVSP